MFAKLKSQIFGRARGRFLEDDDKFNLTEEVIRPEMEEGASSGSLREDHSAAGEVAMKTMVGTMTRGATELDSGSSINPQTSHFL